MEEILIKFLKAWIKSDYKAMYNLCTLTWKQKHTKIDLKNLIVQRIKGYSIEAIIEQEGIKCLCDVKLKVKTKGKIRCINIRMIQEESAYKASEKGTWGVNPISLIKNLYS